MDSGAVRHLPGLPRHFALDERGVGLRATWHSAHGFVNLSLWSGDHCVQTFHLTPAEAGRLVGFLAGVLAGAVPEPAPAPPHRPALAAVPEAPATSRLSALRGDIAELLDTAARRLRP